VVRFICQCGPPADLYVGPTPIVTRPSGGLKGAVGTPPIGSDFFNTLVFFQ